jgi:hypothetical protein
LVRTLGKRLVKTLGEEILHQEVKTLAEGMLHQEVRILGEGMLHWEVKTMETTMVTCVTSSLRRPIDIYQDDQINP